MTHEEFIGRTKSGFLDSPIKLELASADGEPIPYPPVVIEGLLRQSEILLMGGAAKRWKSWARLDLLYCVANGFDWLGRFRCHQGRVLHLDLELLEADLRWRFAQIHKSYCEAGAEGSLQNIRYAALRGKSFELEHIDQLSYLLAGEVLVLLSVDPVYRLLGGRGENDQVAVASLMNRFLAVAAKLNVGVALLQHFAKGDGSGKDAQDRFSGSGVWSRFPDALMTFTDHEQENCFGCEFVLRSFKPIESIGVRWEFPRFIPDDNLDPENLKAPRRASGRPQKMSTDQFCAIFPFDDVISFAEISSKARTLFGISERTVARKLGEALTSKAIYKTPNGYGLTVSYLSRNGDPNCH